ncbi:uncharacterized protein YbaP (TraB family) [Mucilaginibacter frigoritolerans]|uniref:Uncharacterized protein YbaP (TraB family) n=1 Tax=Mucilaginibacter frigoritolerans TaxID=652788 RepID=A0A562TL03_9SPHI|nr:TraB/GumN family protein [Mucilaginibacter frigoritolerans]TWI94217.1 uncharacterized protein YbaP (TraB family) [Mucilaginibacter frigoritolerans]
MTFKTHLIRAFLVCSFILCLVFNGFSQQMQGYSLLWKITGNGLAKPSYLFGTMHVKDRRVFNFSDSVMLSLQSCRRFALEVHPDTLLSVMFAAMQNTDTLRNLDKLLSKQQYDAMAKKFQKKNGYPMGKIDPMVLESLMEPDDNKPDDAVSFIDAYLYGIARTLNKNIYGLENAESQYDEYYGSKTAVKERLLDLLDDNNEASVAEGKDEMVKIYSSGNLDKIYKYIQQTSMIDSSIIARNKVMAASMIKYMDNEGLFTAVGVAHLPGPDGVIALLKKAGYTVTCVKASFTGVAAKYHIDYMKMDWPLYRNEDEGYAINFPGNPVRNQLYGMNNVLYPDLANNIYYGVYAIKKGTPDQPLTTKEAVSSVLVNMAKTNTIISKKELEANNYPCTEVLVKNKTGYVRTRLIFANNLLYSVYASSKVNHLNQSFVDRYFNSFTSFALPEKPLTPWISFTSDTGAFTVNLPSQPQLMVKEIPSTIQERPVSFKMKMYVSSDTVNSRQYLLRYNDFPPGTFLGGKDVLFNSIEKEFDGKAKIVGQPVKIYQNGVEGREVKLIITGGYNAVARLFVKGNRIYLLMRAILQPDLKDDQKDAFFDSFKINDPVVPQWYTYQPDSANFKIQLVYKPEVVKDSLADYKGFINHSSTAYATDPCSGAAYVLEYGKLSPYFRIENTDSLYTKLIRQDVDYQDTLLKTDTIICNGIIGREVISQNKTTKVKKRMRLLVNDDDVFCLLGHMDETQFYDTTSNYFFNSLHIIHADTKKINLRVSKAALICRDLASTDTTVRKGAVGALNYYKFKADELPYVYSALQKNYPDDTTEDGTRVTLLDVLKKVNNDTTITFLTKLYPKAAGLDEIKSNILTNITQIDRKTGFDIYLKLLTSNPPLKVKYAYRLFRPMNDSAAFAAEHFDQLLPFIKNDNYRSSILTVAGNIKDLKNAAYDKMLADRYLSIMAYAQADIDNYIKLKDSTDNRWSGCVYGYMNLMSKIKNTAINDKLTKRYISKDPKGLYLVDAVVARISNNLPVNPLLTNKLLDSLDSRYDVMKAYNSQKQLAKVPQQYRTQVAFAKLCLYKSISVDDEGVPSKFTLLGTVTKNGSLYYAFKFLMPDENNDKGPSYLIGISGPYKPGSIKLNFEKYCAVTQYEKVTTNWRTQALSLIDSLLAQDGD